MKHPDVVYAEMVNAVLAKADTLKDNRTNTKTIGIIGHSAEYEVSAEYNEEQSLVIKNFPLLTTKKVFWKGVMAELFWLINGQTNIRFLEKNDVHIWTDWPLKNYNNSNPEDQLTKEEFSKLIVKDEAFAKRWGDLGPVYGKQWRAWEKPFNNTIEYIDQLSIALNTIWNNPSSRRIIVSAWNPADIAEMEKSGLPPCHTLFQFFVEKEGDQEYLSLLMYQRSLDVMLGAPFNIASYTMLMCMVAEYAGMLPRKFIHKIGDCHIYENHIEQMREQLTREPFEAPEVVIDEGLLDDLMGMPVNAADLPFDDFMEWVHLNNYKHHAAIKGEVAV